MRSHWCGELRKEHSGRPVTLAGWVHRRRDHGGLIFLDLRDREGLIQIVADPALNEKAHRAAEEVRGEYVLRVEGEVRGRPPGSENLNLPTGEVEVVAQTVTVLSRAETPPFVIEDGVDASEETRLRYRYLDLRRPEMQRMLSLRHRVVKAIRAHLDGEGFIEIETPILTKATPEGARDFLVASRLEPGRFFALPQSPQLFKQLLMVAGVDRYYQIARCFRDEDPRSDRQPEFTQLDLEMSFTDEGAIMDLTERMLARIFREVVGVELTLPFPRMRFDESYARFGTDRPDLRFGLELTDVTDVFRDTSIRVFRSVIDDGGGAVALRVPGQAEMGRKDLESLTHMARNLGVGGMAWVAFKEEGVASPLGKAISEVETGKLSTETKSANGDLVLIVTGRHRAAASALGAVRLELAARLGLRPELLPTDPDAWKFCWIVETPLVNYNEEESRWDPEHHPFTAPRTDQEHLLATDPGAVRARAYDIVLNGWEVGGGGIRIHDVELQRKIFALIGLSDEDVELRFGWFVDALRFGVPPHGGIAPGIDRIVARILGKDEIRSTIAFPKTGAYTDPLTGAPDPAAEEALKELGIQTTV